jgi:hypothetical protein
VRSDGSRYALVMVRDGRTDTEMWITIVCVLAGIVLVGIGILIHEKLPATFGYQTDPRGTPLAELGLALLVESFFRTADEPCLPTSSARRSPSRRS